MFFSQSIYGARPSHTEDLHDQNDEMDSKPAMIEMEDASHLFENGEVAEQGKSCIPIMESPLTLCLLVPNRDEPRVSSTSTNTAVPPTLMTSTLMDSQRPAELKYPVRKYLPPPGPYYDRCTFASVMHQGFRKAKKWCGSCWMPRHGPQPSCMNKCWICGTKQPTGKVSARDVLPILTKLVVDLSTALLRHEVVSKQNRA